MCERAVPSSAGFTLIELLVVIVILGILAGLIVPNIMDKPEEARKAKARMQLEAIENSLKMFKLDTGFYPTTEQGLKALVEKPSTGKIPLKWREGGYLEKGELPKDPWGNDFAYLCPGVHNKDFDLWSYGQNGAEAGEGSEDNVVNWKK
ncbi:MAG: type II secretion system major pseudopilin GspG [Deltaproteobacteria bacterium]|nr:type II secretion system major pseudopilin GspG [Deltaproteobacteria bacterium]